jgi:recombination protein RecT
MSEAREALVVYQKLEEPSFLQELAKAIPNALKPERMVRLAYTVLRKNPALARCDLKSIMAGVVECAQMGLELGGVLGHADLVPFGGEAVLIIGYKGFAHLMYQSGQIVGLSAEVVRPGDKFSRILGTERRLIHVPGPIPTGKNGEADENPDTWLGAYAAVKMITGATEFEYLEKALIYSARSRSQSYRKHLKEGKQSPWVSYPDVIAMWCKTPIRRLAKRMPVSTTDQRAPLLRAAMIDEYGDRKGLLIPTLGGYQVNENPPDDDEDAGADVIPTTEVANRTTPPAVNRPPRKAGKRDQASPAGNADVLPKAKIPTTPIDVKNSPAPAPAEDPFISGAEQTDVYNRGIAMGWKIDEVRSFLTKRFKIDSVKLIRRSQLAGILKTIESGT